MELGSAGETSESVRYRCDLPRTFLCSALLLPWPFWRIGCIEATPVARLEDPHTPTNLAHGGLH